jgi:hypothetical protein
MKNSSMVNHRHFGLTGGEVILIWINVAKLSSKRQNLENKQIEKLLSFCGCLCGLPGYRSRGPGSIPAPTKFSEK